AATIEDTLTVIYTDFSPEFNDAATTADQIFRKTFDLMTDSATIDDAIFTKVTRPETIGDIEIAVGRFAVRDTPGLQSISVGFEPKAYMLFYTNTPTDDVDSATNRGGGYSIGMTDGKNSFAMATTTEDDTDPSTPLKRQSTNYVLLHITTGQDNDLRGTAVHESFDPTGFTINVVDDMRQDNFPLVEYIAFGGAVTPNVGTVPLATNQDDSVVVSGIGFEPDLVMSGFTGTFHRGLRHATQIDYTFSLGWQINPDIQAADNTFSMMVATEEGHEPPITFSRFDDEHLGTSMVGGVTGPAYNITSWDNSGFTVTTRLANAAASAPFDTMGFLALDFGDSPEIYTTSRDARQTTGADGTGQAGFEPVFLFAVGSAENDSGEVNVNDSGGSMAIGMTNATNTYALSHFDRDDVTGKTNTNTRTTNTHFLSANTHTGGINYEATFTTFNATGWEINYDNAADDDYQIAFLAIGDNYDLFAPPAAEFMQPDAGAPGMNVAVQFFGNSFNSTQKVTTNSSDIVVGPTIVTDEKGDVVTAGGRILTTMFFINVTAGVQNVTVSIDGVAVIPKFQIIIPSEDSGDFTGQGAGPHLLGNGVGRNGIRTAGGTIVLNHLIVPAGTTVTVDTSDTNSTTAPNEGFLPAIILVRRDVDIDGTIEVNGEDGSANVTPDGGAGGDGGPGGGGGGAGGPDAGDGGNGGDGYTGGGSGACDRAGARVGGTSGGGVGSLGLAGGTDCDGTDGGSAIIGNYTGGG
ncbi:MAG: hypothetical protein V3R41_06060, partial [Gammaproteobacteria bacterium]